MAKIAQAWSRWVGEGFQPENFGSVREKVKDYLRKGSGQRMDGGLLLQILVWPSFESMQCYEVFALPGLWYMENGLMGRPARYCALRISWNEEAEYARFSELGPENYTVGLEHLSFQFDINQLSNLFNLFSQAKIPIWMDPFMDYMGCDGTTYELRFGDEWLGVRYQWWGEAPGAWQPLHEATQQAMAMMNSVFDRKAKK